MSFQKIIFLGIVCIAKPLKVVPSKDPDRGGLHLKISCQMTDRLKLPVYLEPRSWFAYNITLSFCNFNFSVCPGSRAIFGQKCHATFHSFEKLRSKILKPLKK